MPNPTPSSPPRHTGLGLTLAFLTMLLALVLPGTLAGDGVRKLNFFLPYAAVAAVFVLLAAWSIFTVDATVVRSSRDAGVALAGLLVPGTMRRLLAVTFLLVFVMLAVPWGQTDVGVGGVWGRDAIHAIGGYFGHRLAFNLLTAASNALAITAVAQLMWACACVHRMAEASAGATPEFTAHQATQLAATCQRAVVELLQAGATFAFISTTALFLFFSLSEEIQALGSQAPPAPTVACSVERQNPALASWHVQCRMPQPQSTPQAQGRVAASMAFAVGVAFAAVLFVSLLTAGRAVDAAIVRAERRARWAASSRASFSSTDWRKQQGLPESSFVQSLIQAVLLFAPTGAAGLAALLQS